MYMYSSMFVNLYVGMRAPGLKNHIFLGFGDL